MSLTLSAEPVRPLVPSRVTRAAASAAMLGAAALLAAELFGSTATEPTALPVRAARPPAPMPAPVPIQAPGARGEIEFRVTFQSSDSIRALLERAGADRADLAAAAALVPPDAALAGTAITIALGKSSAANRRSLEQLTIRTDLAATLTIDRTPAGRFVASTRTVAVDSTPLRIRGHAGQGLYWSLRAAGAPADAAAVFVAAVGPAAADDRFDLVLARRRAATGESEQGPVLLAALDRSQGDDIVRVRWGEQLIDPQRPATSGFVRPTTGRVSSTFGRRVHPILRFVRYHQGVDIAAPWGSPVVAAADGTVVGSGWSGGHGRRVRIAHSGGRATGYSHLSRIVAAPGAQVRQGEVIGYVGSSGFSTGPHLHFELHENGLAVDPLRAAQRRLDPAEIAGIQARARQLLAVDPA